MNCSVTDCAKEAAFGRKGLCGSHYKKQYYSANRNKLAEISKLRMRTVSKEKRAERARKYVCKKPEERKQKKSLYYKKNVEKFREYKQKMKEHANAVRRESYPRNKEKIAFRNSIRKAIKKGGKGIFTIEQIKELFAKQRGFCAICRCSIKTKYHKDHIIPLAKSGANTIDNIQLLCVSCNTSKQDRHPVDFMQSRGYLI